MSPKKRRESIKSGLERSIRSEYNDTRIILSYDPFRMIWETENVGSFYLDNNTGKNTALYPRSHTHYWWSTLIPKDSDFVYENVSKPWLLQFTSKKAMSAYGTALVAGTATWFLA